MVILEPKVNGVAASPTILHTIIQYMGGGGFIDIKPNTPKEIIFPAATLHYERLWGRINVNAKSAVLEFDEPKPRAVGTKFMVPFDVNINSVEVTDNKVTASTLLGDYEIWGAK